MAWQKLKLEKSKEDVEGTQVINGSQGPSKQKVDLVRICSNYFGVYLQKA